MESTQVFFIILFSSCFLSAGSLTAGEETLTTEETFEQELTTDESFADEYEMSNESNDTYEYKESFADEYEMSNESNETYVYNETDDWNEEGQPKSPYFECQHSCQNSSRIVPCNCDELCSYYGDCCYDSKHIECLERKSKLECRTLPTASHNAHFFTVATCPVNWTESSDIEERCVAEERYEKDPLFTVPVTNLETGLVYKNRFCAVCNGDEERVIEWSITARCFIPNVFNVSTEYIIENLVYNETKESLGFWMDFNGERTFVYCRIKFIIPEVVSEKLRECLVTKSECPESFKNSELERLCDAYLDPVTFPNAGMYRNMHCARCNGESQNDFYCYSPVIVVAGPYLFNRAFDLNYQPVENDAKVKGRCEENEKYDPLFKKCRKLRITK